MVKITLQPVGYVSSSRREVRDDEWDTETTSITLDSEMFGEDALLGLADFSHVEIIYFFDRVDPSKVELGARRPRGNPSWPRVGIFSQRGKNRPNRLGVTVARVVRVADRTVVVSGLDAIDGSPVLDVKPYIREFGPRGEVHQPAWATELMLGYWGAAASDQAGDSSSSEEA